jgi:DNA repair exonuclease SbcCD ATPase subunit
MMSLRKIKLEGFRGARLPVEIDFTNRYASIAIYGDNGGGKSTITDALEWFYFNKIEHLWREDCKEECLRNTHFPDNQDAVLSIEFSDSRLNSNKTLSAKFRSKYTNNTQEFGNYLEQSKKERLFLRYGDILRFVLFTKAEKRSEILNIIGYRHISDVRSTLVSACNSLEKNSRFRSVRDQIEKNNAYLMEKIGQTMQSEGDLYLIANTQIKPLNLGVVVTDEASLNACIEAIQVKTDKIKLERSQKLSDLKRALESLKKEVEKTENYDGFLTAYTELLKDKEKIKRIGLRELLEKGQDVIQYKIVGENICPLCLSSIDSLAVLKEIDERLQELEEINKEVQDANSKKSLALLNLKIIKKTFDESARTKIEDDADFKFVNDAVSKAQTSLDQTIKEVEGKFERLEIIEKDTDLFEKQFSNLKTEIAGLLPKIKTKIAALAETESQRLQFQVYDLINNANRIFKDNKVLSKELDIFETQLNTVTKIRDSFIQLQGEILQKALNGISVDVDKFYSQINPEEGIEKIRLDLVGEEGVEFKYTFHGKDSHPPLKYLSESHLNCLGICLFMASVKLFNKVNKFFVLDDVIASFDSDHRVPFLRLLQDHFKEYQVLLLTHEKFWYELINGEMKPLGWLFNDVTWSIDDGIQFRESIVGIRERIERKSKVSDFDVGNDLRKLLEHILKQISLNLEVKMKYLPDGLNERRMIGEMLSELRGKLNREKCNAKDAPILDRLATSSLITTRTSHDSSPFQSKGDIQRVMKDIDEFENLFLCPVCKKYVSIEYGDKSGKKVKCKCGKKEIDWQFQ